MRGFIRHPDYELEYLKFGSGPRTLIAFHGFNNNAYDFECLENICGERFTIISVNIFFHGSSTVKEHLIEKGFTNDDLRLLFNDIHNISSSDRYTLLGYSLGGRIVLKLFELFPGKTEEIILLAPDGIKVNPFYLFLTRTLAGQRLLRNAVHHPNVFKTVAGFLRKTKIVSEKRYQFAYNNFENKSRRERVYQVWMTLRNVVSRNKEIKSLLKKFNVPMHMFFGRYDKIIPPSIGIGFMKGVENQVSLHVLEEGHRLVKPDVLEKVMKLV